jgi:uncharacterized surface protein with fasciclin (FAS1) repeats
MTLKILLGSAAFAALALAGCNKAEQAEAAPETQAAQEAAGDKTIAAGLGDSKKFAEAAKATGLEATLAGPGPYTVLVPTDAAFDKMPAGALDTLMKPEGKSDLTAVLTYHILPGTILAQDISKAIEAGKGKAQLPTMGGGTLTATKEGDAIVLADGAGTKARLGGEEQRSNGVIHHVDAVMMPSKA